MSAGCFYFFFNDTATTEIYTLSLHDASSDLRRIRRCCDGTAFQTAQLRPPDENRDRAREKRRTRQGTSLRARLTLGLPFPTERTGDSREANSRKINQPVADGVNDEFSGLVDSQSVHHVGTMDGDRVGAEVEGGRNLLVGLA